MKNMKRIHSITIKQLRDDSEPIIPEPGIVWENYCIRAEAEVSLTTDAEGNCLIQHITSGGLWGIESDSDASYLAEIEQEQLAELREQLHAIGFSKRAISAAMKNVERKES